MTIVNGSGKVYMATLSEVSKPRSGQNNETSFSNVLSGAINEQAMQSKMEGMSGFSGLDMISGIYTPSAMAGMENTIMSTAEQGEMSGAQLMLFMMLMMMQTGDGGGDLAPIMQMLTQMLSEPQQISKDVTDLQNNSLWQLDTDPAIRQMVDIALSKVGTQERNRDGSIGNGNYTEFGAWYGMDGQPWCAMFVSWAADKAGLLNSVVPRHASTSQGVAAYKAKDMYSPRSSGYIPKEGDAIYFQNPSTGRMQHVGIVVAYDPATKRVYTVEGNTSNAVRIRHYDINNTRIHGYGRNGGTSYGRIPGSSTSGSGANTI